MSFLLSRDFSLGDRILVEAKVVAPMRSDEPGFDPRDVNIQILGAFGPAVTLRVYPNAPVGRLISSRDGSGTQAVILLPPAKS